MSPKFWELRLLKRFVKRKLLAVSWGSFGDVFKFPLTCNMFCPICCLIKPMILGSTCLPYASVTKKVSFAVPLLVEISACLMHKPFSRNILVISERSPSLSSVHSSNSSSCTRAQFLENDKNKGRFMHWMYLSSLSQLWDPHIVRGKIHICDAWISIFWSCLSTSKARLSMAASRHSITRCRSASELTGSPSICLM